jgi:dTDP-4-amino-4,6-dideoxygalactose transaminase
VSAGTAALELCLRALGIGPGDAVLTVSHTSVATVAAIELVGATPVFVDVEESTCCIDPALLEGTLVRWKDLPGLRELRPAAVLPVHLYGHPADMESILRIAAGHGLCVVEDCSQAHGASIDGRQVGTFGHAAAFSLYPTKNLGAFGDAGLLVAREPELAARARRLRQYGWDRPQRAAEAGTNARLDELQAAILRVRLRVLEAENAGRNRNAEYLCARLAGTGLRLPTLRPGCRHVFHQFVVRSEDRPRLIERLSAAGVDAGIHYPEPVHAQPAYAGRLPLGFGGLPVTDSLRDRILSLPVHPWLTPEELRLVADSAC